MIEVDPGIPLMSSSSDVAPTIRESGTTLHLAFRLPSEDSALLSFIDVCDWHYGYPNDEALDAHPLYGFGLTPYNFHRTQLRITVREPGSRRFMTARSRSSLAT